MIRERLESHLTNLFEAPSSTNFRNTQQTARLFRNEIQFIYASKSNN